MKRHCLIKAYLWHVCKVPVRRSMVGSSTAHLWRTKKHADDKNKTILMRQSHEYFATAGWNRYCKYTVANTKDEDLYVGEQPLTAGCDRCCRLLFYGSGKGASVGERHRVASSHASRMRIAAERLQSSKLRIEANCCIGVLRSVSRSERHDVHRRRVLPRTYATTWKVRQSTSSDSAFLPT